MVNFIIYDVTDETTKNYNTYIAQYLNNNKKVATRQLITAPLTKYWMRNVFLEKSCVKCGEEGSPRPLYEEYKLNISLNL